MIWAYDKRTGKSFETNIRNVAGETHYYDVAVGPERVSMEEGLAKLEGLASQVIDRVTAARSLGVLSEDDRVVLAVFVAMQLLRGPNHRESLRAMNRGLRDALMGQFGLGESELPEMTADGAKAIAMKALMEPQIFAEHIVNKAWLLFETTPEHPFLIGDSPVALQNEAAPKGALRGNLGLAVRGIEIYVPIGATLCLGLFCRSHEERIRNGVERMRAAFVRDPEHPMGFGELLHWRRAFRTGVALPSTPDHVLNHNSLQVSHAERWVFSSQSNFELVESMISEEPRYRQGPRPEVV